MIDLKGLKKEEIRLAGVIRNQENLEKFFISSVLELNGSNLTNLDISTDMIGKAADNKSLTWIGKVLLLAYHKGRLFFEKNENTIYLCFSTDSITPSMFLENPFSKRCSCCPLNSLFTAIEDFSPCNIIHSLLVMTIDRGKMLSLSLHDEKAREIELLIAALELSGGEFSQYQVDMQLAFLNQEDTYVEKIRFKNLKKLTKVFLNHSAVSLLDDYQPSWLREALHKTAKATEPSLKTLR